MVTKAEYKENGYYIELYFNDIPDERMQDTLKLCNWKWFGKNGCWSNRNNEENREFARSICELYNKEEEGVELKNLPKTSFDEVNVIVRSNSFYCNSNHFLVDMAGEIDLCDRKGNIRTYVVPVVFCATCETFYILESIYKDIIKNGIVLCQILEYETYIKHGKYNNSDGFWRTESPLKIMGYNVSKESGLSETQRRVVLERIVDKGILTKDNVISYLDFFVRMHSNMPDAISKWEADKKYIANYKLLSSNRVHISGVTYYVSR